MGNSVGVPRENPELARRGYATLDRGGVDAVLELLDPEVELVPILGWLSDPETFRGHAGVRSWFGKVAETDAELRRELREHTDVPAGFVAAVRVAGVGRTSGGPIEATVHQLWTVRDGKGSAGVTRARSRGRLRRDGSGSCPRARK